jgi:hypothetical protein
MSFQTLQRRFLAHLKHPQMPPLPVGFAEQGAAIYVDLLYNKFNASLETCFPVARQLLGDDNWRQLVRDFIAEHDCQSPYYRQIPDEFIAYLQTERNHAGDPPFLLELVHFEWLELALAIAEAEIHVDADPVNTLVMDNGVNGNDWLCYRPLFVPVFEVFQYAFPVHKINRAFQPQEKPEQHTFILGFRDRFDDVQFIELQPATVRLLDIIQLNNGGLRQAADWVAEEAGLSTPEQLYPFAIEIMNHLLHQGAILSAEPMSNEYA